MWHKMITDNSSCDHKVSPHSPGRLMYMMQMHTGDVDGDVDDGVRKTKLLQCGKYHMSEKYLQN